MFWFLCVAASRAEDDENIPVYISVCAAVAVLIIAIVIIVIVMRRKRTQNRGPFSDGHRPGEITRKNMLYNNRKVVCDHFTFHFTINLP